MTTDQEFRELLQRVREGSEDAARFLVEQYSPQLRKVIRRRLSRRIRSKFDSADFEQAVWTSIFAGSEGLPEFDNSRHMVKFLTRMAENKVVDECRKRLVTSRRNVRREVAPGSALAGIHATSPRPSEMARANDLRDRCTEELPGHYRPLVDLKLAGMTHSEIADTLGVDEKTVQRMLRHVARKVTP